MSGIISPKIVTSGLVLALDAANTNSYPRTGNSWFDLSGNNINGTLTNCTFSSTFGGRFSFNGSTSLVNCGTATNINNIPAITICSWINKTNFSAAGQDDRIVTKRNSAQGSGWWDFYTKYTQTIGFNADFLTTDINRETSTTIDLNTNNFVCVTWDGSATAANIKFYINGVEASYTNSINGVGGRVTETTNNLYIGNGNWGNRPFFGSIYNTIIYNITLSATEVLQNYNATKARFGL
jgi:hypothetical protein